MYVNALVHKAKKFCFALTGWRMDPDGVCAMRLLRKPMYIGLLYYFAGAILDELGVKQLVPEFIDGQGEPWRPPSRFR